MNASLGLYSNLGQMSLQSLMFEGNPAGMLLVDDQSRIIASNSAGAFIFGYQPAELNGLPLDVLLPSGHKHSHKDLVQMFFSSPSDRLMGGLGARIFEAVKKDGTATFVQLGLNHRLVDGKPHVVVAVIDQSEVHRLTHELTLRNEMLRERNKEIGELYAAQSHLLHVVSHELKTPLHAVLGLSQVVRELVAHHESVGNLLTDLDVSARLAVRTLRTLTDLSDTMSNKFRLNTERFNLMNLVRERINVLQSHFRLQPDAVHYHFDVDQEVVIEADRIRLRRLFFGLVANAIMHSHGTKIDVHITCRAAADEPYLQVAVIDDGVGIDQCLLDSIHMPMANAALRMKRGSGGLGVDLYLHQQYVKAMNGELWIDSAPNKGTKACFKVPLHIVRLSGLTSGSSNADALKGIRVLLAEDERIVAKVTAMQLTKLGADVTIAANGRDAFELAVTKLDEPFELILMDLDMPEMNGYEATKAIRSLPEYQFVPIYAVTAGMENDAFPKALQSGMNKCFSKPFNPAALLDAFQKAHNSLQSASGKPISMV